MFLVAHSELFDNYKAKIPSKLMRNQVSYKKMSKNVGAYGDKLIKVSGLEVRQIWENGKTWGYKNDTYVNLTDSSCNVYSVRLFSKMKNAYEGSHVTLAALPLDCATYENVSGGSTWAIMCAGVKVE